MLRTSSTGRLCLSVGVAVAGAATLAGCQPTTTTTGTGDAVTVTDRLNTVTVPAGKAGQVTASCQNGEEAVGGGFGLNAARYGDPVTDLPASQFPVVGNYPASVTSWTVAIFNRSGSTELLVAHVECASKPVGMRIVKIGGPVGGGRAVTAGCPQGTTAVTGGGWSISNVNRSKDVVSVTRSAPLPGQSPSWVVATVIPARSTASTTVGQVTSFAMCATQVLKSDPGVTVNVTAPGGTATSARDGSGSAPCAAGAVLTGGGYSIGDTGEPGVTTFFPGARSAGAEWDLTVYSLPAQGVEGSVNSGLTARLTPVCARAQ